MGDEGTERVQHSKRELKRRHSNKDEQSVHPISDDTMYYWTEFTHPGFLDTLASSCVRSDASSSGGQALFNQVVSGNTTALSASRGQSEEPDQQSIHWLDHFCIGWQSIRGRVTSENSDENQARAGSGRTGCKVSRRKEKKGGKNG
ncbi:hypothetical protein OUZ56_002268 [Daphnia magna]|uniref:Uncharacterized protein n=1 Tax=Daphnia magna TaxID=35525 RepID=A0ABR0A5M2_9CRUS|nr:hypothetical protein OUZ56_002268 [Daphnia magna]